MKQVTQEQKQRATERRQKLRTIAASISKMSAEHANLTVSKKLKKYCVYEEATYDVEATSSEEALEKFLAHIRYPFGVEVHEREVFAKEAR
jgi:FKBP-type peptidyl-prolyl cis-trans isomerase